jgi:hypothetical protein
MTKAIDQLVQDGGVFWRSLTEIIRRFDCDLLHSALWAEENSREETMSGR